MNKTKYAVQIIFAMFTCGCSSSTPMVKTYTEFIPPITKQGLECIENIDNELNRCSGEMEHRENTCKMSVLRNAEMKFHDALANYEIEFAEAQKRGLDHEEQGKRYALVKEKEYKDCLNKQKASGECYSEYFSTLPQYQPKTFGSNYVPRRPKLEDFVDDAICYSDSCYLNYESNYEKCQGKVVKTIRCFANCDS